MNLLPNLNISLSQWNKEKEKEGVYLVHSVKVVLMEDAVPTCCWGKVVALVVAQVRQTWLTVCRLRDLGGIITFKNVPTMHKFEHERATMNKNDIK